MPKNAQAQIKPLLDLAFEALPRLQPHERADLYDAIAAITTGPMSVDARHAARDIRAAEARQLTFLKTFAR